MVSFKIFYFGRLCVSHLESCIGGGKNLFFAHTVWALIVPIPYGQSFFLCPYRMGNKCNIRMWKKKILLPIRYGQNKDKFIHTYVKNKDFIAHTVWANFLILPIRYVQNNCPKGNKITKFCVRFTKKKNSFFFSFHFTKQNNNICTKLKSAKMTNFTHTHV